MNYHNITTDDMNNGDGLRTVLWCSGCSHNCKGCQNPQTHDENSGIAFDKEAKEELFRYLSNSWIEGITFSGGDPLYINNRPVILELMKEIKEKFPNKDIWCYTGFAFEQLQAENLEHLKYIDTLVDGKFELDKRDVNLKWKGSSNQRVIDVQKSIELGTVILHDNGFEIDYKDENHNNCSCENRNDFELEI